MEKQQKNYYAYLLIGSAFGLGLMPFAPGTFGTLLGVILHIVIVLVLPLSLQWPALLVVFFLVCAANNWLTPWAVAYWQQEDPGHFVLDEVAGYLLVPLLFHQGQLWQVALWGFLLFRVFDIIKIPPARQVDQQIHGAWGILLDDLVSSVYVVLVMYGLWWLGPKIGLEKWLISSM
ncbi:MAG: phosphatidylglycerophosphatase A [Candidatus Vecturithrix sp.]|jgi:phosphatidylglycerophosphatase A|nr:phosphatidylglycerophosphatase A [Candidatus Vecturithrix sp.]